MATTTEQNTIQCPGCGAKIPRTVSICPYCVTPQQKAAGDEQLVAEEIVERLGRMSEKDEYADGMAWTPHEGIPYRRAHRQKNVAIFLVVVGLSAGASGFNAGPATQWVIWVFAGVLLLVGIWQLVGAKRKANEILQRPLLKRAARVADRRSETSVQGAKGETIYFFQLEFDDGTSAEFGYPGRGAAEEPLTNGVTGIAYTRGQELLAFKRIRV